jgi:hypothetical protein
VCYSYKLENFAFYDFHFGNNNEWWIANMGTLYFNQYDVLTIEEFNGNSSCLAGDVEMIFGGVGGYVRFYPDSIRGKTSA